MGAREWGLDVKAYYKDDLCTLFHGDCREVLQSVPKANLILTDPVWPNAVRGKNELKGAADPYGLFASALWSMPHLPERMVIVLRSDSDPRFLSAVPKALIFFRCQILSYAVPGYIGRKLGGDEIAYGFGRPIPSSIGKRLIPGWSPKAQPQSKNGHPCSRALCHFEWLIKWWTCPGDLVVDPFAGIGTTLVAAKRAGHQAIGIEIERKFCRMAADRLSETSPMMCPDG